MPMMRSERGNIAPDTNPTIMRKSLLLLTALATAAFLNTASAQFEQGDNVIGVGVGIGGSYGLGYSGAGVSASPTLNLIGDHGMGDLGPGVWGLGGYIGYKSYRYEYDNGYWWGYHYRSEYRWTYIVIGARGTWHYNEWHGNPNLDLYAGLLLGYRIASYKDETVYPNGVAATSHSSYSGLQHDVFAGARYYISDNFGFYGEVGYGVSNLQVGLVFKL
jgi:hypothetical protein